MTEPAFRVTVAKMSEAHRDTYHVVLERSDRPKDASPFDSVGRITPYMTENKEHAVLDAQEWAEFLGVEFTPEQLLL